MEKHHKKKNKNHEQKEVLCSKNKCKSSKILVLLSIVQILLLITVLVFSGMGNSSDERINLIDEKISRVDSFFTKNVPEYDSGAPVGSDNDAGSAVVAKLDILNEPTLGDENAPVTIVEFSDYQCPYCRKYYTESFERIKENYIDTGKVKYVFKDFPLDFHKMAVPSSILANALRDLKGDEFYFKVHNKMFEKQAELGQGTIDYSLNDMFEWVSELGISVEELKDIYEKDYDKYEKEINEDAMEGSQNGVSGTPSFFINGELIVGAQPYERLAQMIDKNLNNENE